MAIVQRGCDFSLSTLILKLNNEYQVYLARRWLLNIDLSESFLLLQAVNFRKHSMVENRNRDKISSLKFRTTCLTGPKKREI